MQIAPLREVLGNNCRESQESRLELGLRFSFDTHGRTIWLADAHGVTISPGNSQTKCCSGLSKRLAEDGITIRKNWLNSRLQ
jgi:hypothetical protein